VAVNDASGTDSPGGGWAVPMQPVVNKAAIERAIDAMNPVDSMGYKPALTAAYNVLQHTHAKIKHIIVLGVTVAEDSYYLLVTGPLVALHNPVGRIALVTCTALQITATQDVSGNVTR
jgi:hypothetical protein